MINRKLLKRASALTAMVMALSALVACSSGEKSDENKSETTTATTGVIAETSIETATNLEPETGAATEVPANDSKDYFDWWGINMYRPAEYSIDLSGGFPQCSLLSEEGHVNNIVYYTLSNDEITTSEAALEYLYHNSINSDILDAEGSCTTLKDNEIESEEKVNVNGCDFIRQAGIYHCETINSEDKLVDIDFAYVGYFGVMDFPQDGKAPAVWIAFSHTTDDNMKTELARLVDTAAENAKPL